MTMNDEVLTTKYQKKKLLSHYNIPLNGSS